MRTITPRLTAALAVFTTVNAAGMLACAGLAAYAYADEETLSGVRHVGIPEGVAGGGESDGAVVAAERGVAARRVGVYHAERRHSIAASQLASVLRETVAGCADNQCSRLLGGAGGRHAGTEHHMGLQVGPRAAGAAECVHGRGVVSQDR